MNIMFLFGSGADTQAYNSLKSGSGFAEAVVCNRYNSQIKSITGLEASHFKMIYPQSTKIYVQTIYNNQEKAKKELGEDVVKDFVSYYEGTHSDKDSLREKISSECKEWYKIIQNDNTEEKDLNAIAKNNNTRNFFLKNAVLFDSLDEKFNSLRDTNYNSNAKRVINAYLTVFILMLKDLYDDLSDNEWEYEKIFEKLKSNYSKECEADNYYSLLAKSELDFHIATTNYTKIVADIVNGKKDKEVVYLHGKLTWFEDLENLCVYDCDSDDDLKHLKAKCAEAPEKIIPFIMIPSGIKPIICKRQIEEFYKFIQKLNSSNYLVVVGYRFNSEDNHINSIIAEWLRKNKNRLIYLNFQSDSKNDPDAVAFTDMNWAKEFSNKKYDSVEELHNSEEKISVINVNSDNCCYTFDQVIKMLENKKLN